MATEAKQYAQRNRAGSDWFTHDSVSAKTAAPVAPPSELAPAEAPAESALEPSEHVTETTDAVVSEDHVDHSAAAEAPPPAPAAAAAAAPPARAQMIRPKCDSNEWCVSSSLS